MNTPTFTFEGLESAAVCANCGKILDPTREKFLVEVVPGENNYPHAPDEPAQLNLICMDCILPLDVPRPYEDLLDNELAELDGVMDTVERDACWSAFRNWLPALNDL